MSKRPMSVAFVGGRFDNAGGKPSGYFDRLAHEFSERLGGGFDFLLNGGSYTILRMILEGYFLDIDVFVWFADVPNELPKIVDLIKVKWPKALLVTSKRNFDGAYSTTDLLGRALKTKSNLLVELTGDAKAVEATVLDPLGSAFCIRETDIAKVAAVLENRLRRLREFTRVESDCIGPKATLLGEEDFFAIVRAQAERFHEIIHGVGHERMLGNASFRCANGFPSARCGRTIFVSRRDVDKRSIGPESFVAVQLFQQETATETFTGDRTLYYGDDKPSVDTPIQLRLYRHYPRVRYMLHSHTYVEGAPMTSEPVPCGAIEEAAQVIALVPDPNAADFCVNLRGHGSIALASSIDFLRDIKWTARVVPELFVEAAEDERQPAADHPRGILAPWEQYPHDDDVWLRRDQNHNVVLHARRSEDGRFVFRFEDGLDVVGRSYLTLAQAKHFADVEAEARAWALENSEVREAMKRTWIGASRAAVAAMLYDSLTEPGAPDLRDRQAVMATIFAALDAREEYDELKAERAARAAALAKATETSTHSSAPGQAGSRDR
ncbi:MAG: class II aldolase/adducin family protein [Polyangiales bacterium]